MKVIERPRLMMMQRKRKSQEQTLYSSLEEEERWEQRYIRSGYFHQQHTVPRDQLEANTKQGPVESKLRTGLFGTLDVTVSLRNRLSDLRSSDIMTARTQQGYIKVADMSKICGVIHTPIEWGKS